MIQFTLRAGAGPAALAAFFTMVGFRITFLCSHNFVFLHQCRMPAALYKRMHGLCSGGWTVRLAYRCFSCMSTLSDPYEDAWGANPFCATQTGGEIPILEVYDLCPLLRPVRREVSESGAHSPGAEFFWNINKKMSSKKLDMKPWIFSDHCSWLMENHTGSKI